MQTPLAACKGLSSVGVVFALRVHGKRGNPLDHYKNIERRDIDSQTPEQVQKLRREMNAVQSGYLNFREILEPEVFLPPTDTGG
jgi:hypothetical protein